MDPDNVAILTPRACVSLVILPNIANLRLAECDRLRNSLRIFDVMYSRSVRRFGFEAEPMSTGSLVFRPAG